MNGTLVNVFHFYIIAKIIALSEFIHLLQWAPLSAALNDPKIATNGTVV